MPSLDLGCLPPPALGLSAWQGVQDMTDHPLNHVQFGREYFTPCLVLSASHVLFTLSSSVRNNIASLKGQWLRSDVGPHSNTGWGGGGGAGAGGCAPGQPKFLPGKRRWWSLPKVTGWCTSGLFLPPRPWTQPQKAAGWNREVLFGARMCL